ncbi:E2 ubiquitin-conjugating enzyme [Aphelenchoides bicaudatus]|nr:E2 ubiquitin-conjugating enzyme [Aphelenchoides bicaudatus]
MSLCANRVQREIREIVNSTDLNEQGILIEVLDNNIQHLRGYISGPAESLYKNANYVLDIQIPDQYPFKPPNVKFVTRVWHPNVSSATGAICLDILKSNWAASLTLRTVLLSIQALLASPEPNDPQDAIVASQFIKSPDLFERTAKFWACYFAGAKDAKDETFLQKIKKLKDMGVEEETAVSALSCNGWDLDSTITAVF